MTNCVILKPEEGWVTPSAIVICRDKGAVDALVPLQRAVTPQHIFQSRIWVKWATNRPAEIQIAPRQALQASGSLWLCAFLQADSFMKSLAKRSWSTLRGMRSCKERVRSYVLRSKRKVNNTPADFVHNFFDFIYILETAYRCHLQADS